MISRIFLDERVAGDPVAADIIRRVGAPAETVSDARAVYDAVAGAADPRGAGKRILFLTANRGPFIRKCPGTQHYTCCDYGILHIGAYCVLDCSYCILQSYFHPPVLQFFVNHADLWAQLETALESGTFRRIGTGEFTDSLIWEPWTDLTPLLVERFGRQDRAALELKTKTTAVDRLEGLDHRGRTILAWSLNTPAIIRTQERRTASLSARLAAAARVQGWGYRLAFHFDPILLYDGCEEDYRKVIDRLFDAVDPAAVAWISLGTFRFMPDLKAVIAERFPDSRIPYGEFIRGVDGKMRYFKPLRIGIYRRMAEWIQSRAPETTVYFCMEDAAVWRAALGFAPEDKGGLPAMLDAAAARVCGIRV